MEEGLFGGRVVGEEEKQQIIQNVEKVVQTPPTEKIPEKIEPKKPELDWLGEINREFSKEFKTKDEIKSFFDKVGEYDTLKTQHDEVSTKLEEYRKVVGKFNPLDYFDSEDEFVRQQFIKQNKGKLGEEALTALSSLSPERLKKLDNKSTLVTDMIVNDGLTREEAEAYYNKKYDIDEDTDVDPATRAIIKKDVKVAQERLSKMYEGIELPKQVDFEADLAQRKESWKNPLSELVKGIDKIQLSQDVDFVVDAAMKEGLENEVLSELLASGVAVNKDTLANVAGAVRDRILSRNMDKVIESVYNDLKEKVKAEVRAEVHNDKPLNNQTRPGSPTLSNDEKILRSL